VAIGNSFNDDERCVLAGYDNGDVKLFDLRTNKVCACVCWACCRSGIWALARASKALQ
jgi:hypothetical protein